MSVPNLPSSLMQMEGFIGTIHRSCAGIRNRCSNSLGKWLQNLAEFTAIWMVKKKKLQCKPFKSVVVGRVPSSTVHEQQAAVLATCFPQGVRGGFKAADALVRQSDWLVLAFWLKWLERNHRIFSNLVEHRALWDAWQILRHRVLAWVH